MKVLMAVCSFMAFLTFGFAQSDLAQFCQGLLNLNIRDESDTFSTRQTFEKVRDILFTETDLTFSSAQQVQNDLGIGIIDVFDLTFGSTTDESNFVSRKDTFLKDYLSISGLFTENIERVRRINESLANSISQCIQVLADAATEDFFPVVSVKNFKLFEIEVTYKINSANPRPLNLTVEAIPPVVQCLPGLTVQLSPQNQVKKINCTKPEEEVVFVTIRSDNLGDKGNYEIPSGGEVATLRRQVEEMQTQLTGLSPIPRGTVGAFNLAECPIGWEYFSAGAGRGIIGSGQGQGLTNRTLLESGGEETHTLTEAEMPSHTHPGTIASDSGPNAAHLAVQDPQNLPQYRGAIGATGGSQPHNNMQPYIALLFCQKR